MELKIINAGESFTFVALSGRLDIDGAASVEKNFAAAVTEKAKPAVIDMTEVSFITSAGISMLLSSAKALQNCDAKAVLYNPQPLVQEALENAGVHKLMPIENDFSKAKNLLQITE